MSLLIAGALQRSGARVRGPFAATTVEAGDFAPSGASYTAAEAVYTALGADGYLYGFDFEAMRLTSNAPDGVDLGETVGFAHDWRSVGTLGRAAVADVAAQRPTAATVNGVDGLTFSGDPGSVDNQRKALPLIDRLSSESDPKLEAPPASGPKLFASMLRRTGTGRSSKATGRSKRSSPAPRK